MTPILPGSTNRWLTASDAATFQQVLLNLEAITPSGGANLEPAFLTARQWEPRLIILLTDGLPTQSTTVSLGRGVRQFERIQMFRAAERHVSPNIPMNILLFPMSGDPAALFWSLTLKTKSSLVSPSKNWPHGAEWK